MTFRDIDVDFKPSPMLPVPEVSLPGKHTLRPGDRADVSARTTASGHVVKGWRNTTIRLLFIHNGKTYARVDGPTGGAREVGVDRLTRKKGASA